MPALQKSAETVVASPSEGRKVVLTSSPDALPEGVLKANSLDDALAVAAAAGDVETCAVIGGVQLFEEAVRHPKCSSVHYTAVSTEYPCDATLPQTFSTVLWSEFEVASEGDEQTENDVAYRVRVYKRRWPEAEVSFVPGSTGTEVCPLELGGGGDADAAPS